MLLAPPLVLAVVLAVPQTAPRTAASPPPSPEAAREALDRALAFLVRSQGAGGAWGGPGHPGPADTEWSNPVSHRAWQAATTGLACLALLDAPATPERDRALFRGLDFLVAQGPIPRPSDWDTDNVWAHVYGLAAAVRAWRDGRLQAPDQARRREALRGLGQALIGKLWVYQAPIGGWAYYDDETRAYRPSWATSFTTAVAVLGLLDARAQGWEVDEERLARAVAALERCRLPNGAYTYTVEVLPAPDSATGIHQVQGSLSRIQVCNLALWRARQAGLGRGLVGPDDLREGIRLFFREHRWLEIARHRPYPHEAWFYNSGYFHLFGHAYAGAVLAELGGADLARLGPRLWRVLLPIQGADGSFLDFWMNDYGRPYGTAFAALALLATLPQEAAAGDAGPG